MIVARSFLCAFQAAESRTALIIDLDSDLLILRIEVHVMNRPRGRQAKNVLVEYFVLHLGCLVPSNSTITRTKPGWTIISFAKCDRYTPDQVCSDRGRFGLDKPHLRHQK